MEMVKKVLNKWWIALIFGAVGLFLGIKMLINPADSFSAISKLFIIFFIVYGLIETISVIISHRAIPAWGWNFVAALVPFVLGIVLLIVPLGSELLLINIFCIGLVFEGIYLIMNSIHLSKSKASGWVLTLILGIITTALGFFMIIRPLTSVVVIGYLAAFSFLFTGIDFISLAVILSKTKSQLKRR